MPARRAELPPALERALERARAVARRTVVASASLPRSDRERLRHAGYLHPLMKGWYLLSPGPVEPGEGAVRRGHLRDFLAVYLEERLGCRWCLSAENSLELRLDAETVPGRLVVLTERSSTTTQILPLGIHLTVYPDPQRLPVHTDLLDGLRLMSPETALKRLPPAAWTDKPLLVERALELVRDWEALGCGLAQEGRLKAATRLAHALSLRGRRHEADLILGLMTEAGFRIAGPRPGRLPDGPARLASLWDGWLTTLADNLPASEPSPSGSDGLLRRMAAIQERQTDDAVASLALADFPVAPDLVRLHLAEPARAAEAAGWPHLAPGEETPADAGTGLLAGDVAPASLLALQGYLEGFRLVRRSLVDLFEGRDPAAVLARDLPLWQAVLTQPAAEAQLLPPGGSGTLRTAEVPGPWSSPGPLEIPACLEFLLQTAVAGPGPVAARALAAQLGLLWIRPWEAATGRVARFLHNVLGVAGGLPWAVPVAPDRARYLSAVRSGLAEGNPLPLATIYFGCASEIVSAPQAHLPDPLR